MLCSSGNSVRLSVSSASGYWLSAWRNQISIEPMQLNIPLGKRLGLGLGLGPYGILFLATVGVVYYLLVAFLVAVVVAVWLSLIAIASLIAGGGLLVDRTMRFIPSYSRRRASHGRLAWPRRLMNMALVQGRSTAKPRNVNDLVRANPRPGKTETAPTSTLLTPQSTPILHQPTFTEILPSRREDTPEGSSNVPSTASGVEQLLADKPSAWEYLYFAAVMLMGVEVLRDKLHDQEIQFVRPGTCHLTDKEVVASVMPELDRLQAITENVSRIFDADAQAAAFGPPGTPGDPDRIRYLGNSVVAFLGELLDWATDVRGIVVSAKAKTAMVLLASMVNTPIRQTLAFIAQCADSMENIPEPPRPDGSPHQVIALSITLDRKLLQQLIEETRRLAASSKT